MRRVSFYIFTLLLVGLHFSPVLAQKRVDHKSLYWIRYYNTVNFSEQWNWQTELDTRHFFSNSRQQQFIGHTRVAYKPSAPWYFSAGLTGSWQRPQDPYLLPRPTTPELRLVQEGSFTQTPLKNISLNYRIRIEQRFISNHPGAFDEDHRFSFRHRYRIQLSYAWPKPTITFRASDEVFVNATSDNLFGELDQNRVYLALEKRISPAVAFELGFMHIQQPVVTKNLLFRRDALRFTVYHTLDLPSSRI
jgi:hypothetical protein